VASSGARNLNGRNMIETNPIQAQIADLRARVESLRGYL
jgi:hypothetical protein